MAVFLLLIGLYDARMGLWPLRIQLALVYAGASLNKALDPDWWNGRFFDTLMIDALGVRWYERLADGLPDRWLGIGLGTLGMLTEATICGMVLGSRDGRLGVSLMLVFHAAMLVATVGQLSLPFMYASLAVSAAFFYRPFRLSVPWMVPAIWWLAALFIRNLPGIHGWV